jgi:hypothetical protein
LPIRKRSRIWIAGKSGTFRAQSNAPVGIRRIAGEWRAEKPINLDDSIDALLLRESGRRFC